MEGGVARTQANTPANDGTSGWKIEIGYVTRPADLQTSVFTLHAGDIGIPDVGLIYGNTRPNNGAEETLSLYHFEEYQLTTAQRIQSVNNY